MKAKFLLHESDALFRENQPITVSIPFSKGVCTNADTIAFKVNGKILPAQVKVLDYWSDGTIRWSLCDFQISIKPLEHKEIELHSCKIQQGSFASKISVSKIGQEYIIDTNLASFSLTPKSLGLITKVKLKEGTSFNFENSSWILNDERGRQLLPSIDNISIEDENSLRITLKVEGSFEFKKILGPKFLIYLTFYANQSYCKMDVTLWNPNRAIHPGNLWDLGDKGSFYFKELKYELSCDSELQSIHWTMDDHSKLKCFDGNKWLFYQDSSGGENWRSHNHVNRKNEIPLHFKGYRVEYGQSIEKGDRAKPVVILSNKTKSLGVTIDKFWQNFPKAIEFKEDKINVCLFPKQFSDLYELQGGERKTHTIYLNFDSSDISKNAIQLSSLINPIKISFPSKYCLDSGVFGMLLSKSNDLSPEYIEYIDNIVEGKDSFFKKREIIDEYGWRNFGCLYADHEAIKEKGDKPLVSHYNNQYDPLFGFLLHFIRSGNNKWLELVHDLAKHTIDIDIYHTRKDKIAYNGGLFWHTEHYRDAGHSTHRSYTRKPCVGGKGYHANGGGPAAAHNYTTGLLNYYFITGNSLAKEAIIELAEWTYNAENGKKTVFRYIDQHQTGMSSFTNSLSYHGPGRGSGNSINALLDAFILTKNKKYIDRVEVLIQRCCHPNDNIHERKLGEPESLWSYLVFFQVLGKYLDWKVDNEQIDYIFYYARESLLHYARWMLENERPYSELNEKLYLWTETWPAHDMRKSQVFQYAALYADGELRKKLKEKADFFYKRSFSDLMQFETRFLLRPMIIMMNYGVSYGAFLKRYKKPLRISEYHGDFGKPKKFRPQKWWVKCKLIVLGILSIIAFGIFLFIKYEN